jgi:hypothetical protein
MDLYLHSRPYVSGQIWVDQGTDRRIQLSDLSFPVAAGSLANPWRDRLATSVPGDPAVRDRDLKLLAWLEYVEMLRESESIPYILACCRS